MQRGYDLKTRMSILFSVIMILLAGVAGPAGATIMFHEVGLLESNPTIIDSGLGLSVHFFAGDFAALEDAFTYDDWSPGNPYLANGIDPDGAVDTFIGAEAVGFSFATVSFDILSEMFLPTGAAASTTLNLAAYSGGSQVGGTVLLPVTDSDYHSMSFTLASGFDAVRIWDDMDQNGIGDFFHIDNFSFRKTQGQQPVVPEPGTMLLMGIGGLAGLVFLRRKRS